MPGRDLTDIRPERIDASYVEERNFAFPIIAGIVAIALVVGYAGYCFHTTTEMIKKTYEKPGIDLPRSFEKNPPVEPGQ
jgi:hypothetical protein